MGLPQLETCCFVFDLKTGNIIVGCFSAAMSFIIFVEMIVVAATTGVEQSELTGIEDVDLEIKAGITGFYAMCIILVVMFFVKFIFDCLFVYGVVIERAGLIKSYLIMWIVFFLLSMFIFFLDVTRFHFMTIITQLVYMALNVYVILLCNSFYKQLNTREEV